MVNEIGHYVDGKRGYISGTEEWSVIWETETTSRHGTMSALERFAEVFEQSIYNPKSYCKRCPQSYHFITEHMCLITRKIVRIHYRRKIMVLYFSDNKETGHKRKGIFYEETLPENAVIFGSTTLKKYSGGPADYMKIGTKRYCIDEPVNERDVIGYIPVVAERYPSTPSDTTDPTKSKYGYIQLKERFPFLLYCSFC